MKYYIWKLGCAMNKSDAERIASVLTSAGLTETKKESEAELIVTIACSVRQHAIDRIYGKAEKWNKIQVKRPLTTILSGCVLESDRKKMSKMFNLIFEISEIDKLKQFLKSNCPSPNNVILSSPLVIPGPDRESIQEADSGQARMTENVDFFKIHPKYDSTFQAYVPISTGCDNFCTYCAVPYTRGREVSRPEKKILDEVRELVESGYKEITLLGQNVNSYSFTQKNKRTKEQKNNTGDSIQNTDFINLLKKIDKISGNYRTYFYSNHPKDFSDKLINILPKLKHFPHYLHLPLQSGSNKILKAMNRRYTQENYFSLVNKIKKYIPEVAITTDIIVGFPGETEKDFEETKKVVKEVGFDMIYIGKFSPRPGTKAEKMDDNVSQEEKEKRWQELTDILKSHLEKENKKLVGKTLKVLIDSEKKGKYYGRTDLYKVVQITADKDSLYTKTVFTKQTDPIGQFVDVRIVNSKAWMLKGKII